VTSPTGIRSALVMLIAALAAAPLATRAQDEEEAAVAHETEAESPAEEEAADGDEAATDEAPGDAGEAEAEADPEQPAEPGERDVFAYHGMVIEGDEVVDDPSDELVQELFGLSDDGEAEVGTRAPAKLSSTAYSAKCKQEGVPLPPPFSSSSWKKAGRLPANRIFASTHPRADVLVYRPVDGSNQPLGLCVALPRGDEAGSVELLGVICQGKRTGRACFWDNIDRTAVPQKEPVRVKGAKLSDVDIDLFADGALLGENCTNCHRGDNVFVIHEDTFMARAPMDAAARDPDTAPYTPIGQAGTWINPRHASPPGNCTSCHSLPEFSKPYCKTVLLRSLGETMPPAPRPADWKKGHAADLEQICRECGSSSDVCSTP
jgi:hypothetical protein